MSKQSLKKNKIMKKVLYGFAVASLFAFASCDSPAEERAEEREEAIEEIEDEAEDLAEEMEDTTAIVQ
jgi:hypothetical protein